MGTKQYSGRNGSFANLDRNNSRDAPVAPNTRKNKPLIGEVTTVRSGAKSSKTYITPKTYRDKGDQVMLRGKVNKAKTKGKK